LDVKPREDMSHNHNYLYIHMLFQNKSIKKERVRLQVLAKRKIHLVYGGGSLGLMGGVSITVFLGGSQVLGVVPKALAKRDIIGKTIGEELQVPIISDRLNAMFNHADAFIALPSGLGTLE
jgi:predicted Rossmann-fold nucleotide-binding protein